MSKRLEIVLALVADGVVKGANAAKKAVDGLGTELDEVGKKGSKEIDKLTAAMDAFSKSTQGLDQLSGRFRNVGLGMAAAGGAILGGLALASKSGIEFEKTMSAVGAVSNATADQMKALTNQAMELGESTVFTAGEVGRAQEELVKGGLSIDKTMGALKDTLDLASAGNIGLADSAMLMTDALNVFADTGATSERVANALAGAANASSTDVAALTMAFKMSGAAAAAMGLSVEDNAAALGILANAGIKGSDAGTALKTMFLRLAAPTDEAASAMRKLGLITGGGAAGLAEAEKASASYGKQIEALSARQARANAQLMAGTLSKDAYAKTTKNLAIDTKALTARLAASNARVEELSKSTTKVQNAFFNADGSAKSFEEQMRILGEATKDLSQEEKLQALNKIAGQDAIRAALILSDAQVKAQTESIDGLGNAVKNFKEQGMAGVTAAGVAEKKLDNVAGSLTRLGSALDSIRIRIFDLEKGPLRWIVDKLTEVSAFISGLIRDFPMLSGTILAVVTAVGVLLLGLGSLSLLIAGLISGPLAIGGLVVALKALGIIGTVALGPIAIVLVKIAAVLAGVTAAAYLVAAAFGGVSIAWKDLWTAAKNIFGPIWDFIANAIGGFADLFKGVLQLATGEWEGALETWATVFDKWFGGLWKKLKEIWEGFKQIGDLASYFITGEVTAGGVRAEAGSRAMGIGELAQARAARNVLNPTSFPLLDNQSGSGPATTNITAPITVINPTTPMQAAVAVSRQIQLQTGRL